MIWIWLIFRHSHKWNVPLERYFTFVCARCNASMAAMVRAAGYGSGSSLFAAQRNAALIAETNAAQAVGAASCPCCRQLSPTTLAGFDLVNKRLARQRALRVPVAAVLAVVSAILIGIPAVRDVKHSLALAVVSASTSLFLAALSAGILSSAKRAPAGLPMGVWFSQNPANGPASWFPAQPGILPEIEQPNQHFRHLAYATATITCISAFVALAVWSSTFRTVWVVNADREGDMTVVVDGGDPVTVNHVAKFDKDAPFATIEVRTDVATSTILVTDAHRRNYVYEIHPNTFNHGWLIAPNAWENDLCLTQVTWVYSASDTTRDRELEKSDDRILNGKSAGPNRDLLELRSSYDFMLTAPPQSIQTKQSSETRSTLRALSCKALVDEKTVPWKENYRSPSASATAH